MLTFLRNLLRRLTPSPVDPEAPRVTGLPASSNGASSFHLNWEVSQTQPIVGVEATLEVLVAPSVERLYFWALQASFTGEDGRMGGAHLGLQWHPSHPGHTAVNWGGYDRAGRILDGTASTLPSARGNANTRDFPWRSGTRYRLRIARGAESGWWRGEVTDLGSGTTTVVRELHSGGDRLVAPAVWSEVFARCDDPSATVRWSDLAVVDASGEVRPVGAVRLNYQTHESGGCANTTSVGDDAGILQVTSTERTSPQGARLTL